MKVKILEIRDAATFIPAMAIKLIPENDAQQWLLRRASFGAGSELIILCHLGNLKRIDYDVYGWGDRTFATAHDYIEKNWETLKDGDVVCVETILGERSEPKRSERYE